MNYFRLLFCCFTLFIFSTAQASDDEIYDNLIHSDVPLWSASDDNVWPRHFAHEDELGCANRIKFGDWLFTNSDNENIWYRVQNYGVFHCWVNIYEAREREKLEFKEHKPSFFVELTSLKYENVEYDLWAIQIGVRPGSDYLLLARESEKKLGDPYFVLQRKCPRSNIRSGPNLDILLSDYCAINSKMDIIELAKMMLKRPPLGILAYIESDNENIQ